MTINIDEIITQENNTSEFKPEQPIPDVATPELGDVAKRDFLLAINAIRLGLAKIEVAVEYDVQVGHPDDFRMADKDYVSIPGVSPKVHIGPLVRATFNKQNSFYITVHDALRSTGLKKGWTSMRASGIKSFKILSMEPGPVFTDRVITQPMHVMFEMVYQTLMAQVGR